MFILFLFAFTLPVLAADITVIGSKEEESQLQGSGSFLQREQIEKHQSADVNRILKQVPGVYLREEDGLGLFPNISLRGVDPNRSSKLTLMEDGVLIAPAPYSAPAAYFFPNVDRMQSMEILKGSSQIQYGPQTTGGVINFQSATPTLERSLKARSFMGNQSEMKNHLQFSDSHAGLSYQLELYQRQNDGFKTINSPSGTAGPQHTGMRLFEPQVLLRYETQSGLYQRFEFKFGQSILDANETYLGLSDEDFQQDPFQRYHATRFDHFDSRQTRTYLRHFIEWTPELTLHSTVYWNQFNRNWRKLDRVDGENLALTLASENGRQVLRGQRAGELTIRDNDRSYQSMGVDEILKWKQNYYSHSQEWQLGLRLHYDFIQRNDASHLYQQNAGGNVDSVTLGQPMDRQESAKAISSYLQNSIEFGKWNFTPGLRFESVRFETKNRQTQEIAHQRLEVLTAGVGTSYQVNPAHQIYAGLFQGVSLPSPQDFIHNQIQEERSLSFELGHRAQLRPTLHSHSTLFYSQFKDLYIPENLITGSSVSENAGDINSYGLEYQLQWNIGDEFQLKSQQILTLAATYTQSVLASDANSQASGSFFNGGQKGNRSPYIPDTLFNLNYLWAMGDFSVNTTLNYTSSVWSTAENRDRTSEDLRIGAIDSFFTIDLQANYQLNKNTQFVLSALNLTNENYMVSRHAYGPRPGRPLTILAGIEALF